jgi:AraC family transcriptional regulator
VSSLAQIRRGLDYIEAHLDVELETAEVARQAGVSHWHFQRIFKALTNETLKTYIRSRRFAQSLEKLANSDERIVEIALGAGFESQASFTRAFKRAFAVTPAEYRRRHPTLPFVRKVRFDTAYLRHLHTNLTLEPTFRLEPQRRLVGLRTRFYGVDSEKNNLGQKLPGLWAAFVPRLQQLPRVGRLAYGVVRQTPAKRDELEYFAAAELPSGHPVPPDLVAVDVPAGRYAYFTHRGPIGALDRTVNYIYSSWLLRSGLRHTFGTDLEVYGPAYQAHSEDSQMQYAIPVQP